MSRQIAEYYGDKRIRRASISHFRRANGDIEDKLIVHCYEHGELIKSVNCTDHSLFFAEDVAENFVLKEQE